MDWLSRYIPVPLSDDPSARQAESPSRFAQAPRVGHPGNAIYIASQYSPIGRIIVDYLGAGFRELYARTRYRSFLLGALKAHEKAVDWFSLTSRDRSAMLSNLGIDLVCLYAETGLTPYLSRAIQIHDEASHQPELLPADKAAALNNLGIALIHSYVIGGGTTYLERAIQAHEEATSQPEVSPNERA